MYLLTMEESRDSGILGHILGTEVWAAEHSLLFSQPEGNIYPTSGSSWVQEQGLAVPFAGSCPQRRGSEVHWNDPVGRNSEDPLGFQAGQAQQMKWKRYAYHMFPTEILNYFYLFKIVRTLEAMCCFEFNRSCVWHSFIITWRGIILISMEN